MPYQPTNIYPCNIGIDVTEGLEFYFKVDNYDTINKFKIEIYDLFRNKKIFTIVRSVGQIQNNKVIQGNQQIIEIYDENEKQVYIDIYAYENDLPVKGGYGNDSFCELDVSGYLVTLEQYEKSKYYKETPGYSDLIITEANCFDYDNSGTIIKGFSAAGKAYFIDNPNAQLVIPYKNNGKNIIGIAEQAFKKSSYSNINLTSVVFPSCIRDIESNAFEGWSTLKTIYFNYGNSTIGSQCFLGCTGLTSLTLLDSINQIGDGAFSGCTSLLECRLSYTLTTISSKLFYGCSKLESINFPDSVTTINSLAFSNCANLKTVVFNKNLITIGAKAFEGIGIEVLECVEGLQTISENAFLNCTKLKNVNLPNSLSSIEQGVFQGCVNIEKLNIPFVGTSKESNGTINSVLGYIFGTTSATTGVEQFYKVDKTSQRYLIPSKLTTVNITNAEIIPIGAFSNCVNLTSITLNEGITALNEYSFYNCSKLEELIVPTTVTTIGEYAFGM